MAELFDGVVQDPFYTVDGMLVHFFSEAMVVLMEGYVVMCVVKTNRNKRNYEN